jgi:hypothetical protein
MQAMPVKWVVMAVTIKKPYFFLEDLIKHLQNKPID